MSKDVSMVEQYDLRTLAKVLSFDKRKTILASLAEEELRSYLRSLLMVMEPSSVVEITHGPEELGKDLVMVSDTKFGRVVRGIVVKTGVIGGRTMGKVDEIASQVEQCFEHPARLKTIEGPLAINEVWVMVGGEFTTKGQQRLEAKTRNKSIRRFDMRWLVEQFTEYYPQAFFEGRIIDFLKERILKLERRRIVSGYTSSLSESWVEPLVASLESPVSFDEEALTIVFEKGRLPFSQLRQLALPGRNKIILAGDPGTGKSTALAKLALDVLKDSFNLVIQKKLSDTDKVAVPLLTLARDIINFADCEALLSDYIPQEEVRYRFRINMLLVDSLDEVSPGLRSRVIEKATEFGKYLGCSVIVASRKIETVKNPLVEYRSFELLPFDFGRALSLFDKLVSDRQLLAILREGLEKVRFQILMTPLSLSLLIDIAENYREIPASVTELYDRFTDIALGRFDKEKGIEVLFEYEIKKRFLAELAFTCFLGRDWLEIPASDFDDFVADYGKRYMMDESRLRTFIYEIERSGMLRLGQTITFCHRSFLDYFAAYSIFIRQDRIEELDELVSNLYFSDAWGDVAFFYIGSKREISTPTLMRIFSFEKKGLVADIDRFLVGRLLQAGWHSPSEIKVSAIRQSLSFAPAIRETLLDGVTKPRTDKQRPHFPRIFGDFLVLTLCDIAFVSAFLQKEELLLFDELSNQPDSKSLYSSLLLLWTVRNSLPNSELGPAINRLLGSMSKTSSLTSEDQARILLVCSNIEKQDKATNKAIKRKLDRMQKSSPDIFKRLLPHARKGFRRQPRR